MAEIAQWDQMGAPFSSDLSSQLQRRWNVHPRDTQWRTNSKHAMGHMCTLEELLLQYATFQEEEKSS
jgi:hypothetical protein